jgi:hypothetical protein
MTPCDRCKNLPIKDPALDSQFVDYALGRLGKYQP